MSGPAVALVTCAVLPNGTEDDRLLVEPLRAAGFTPSFEVWDDPGVNWPSFAAVVVRSAWDYHLRPAAFAEWVRRCGATGVRLWNPAPVLLWNLHKGYLRTLEERGVRVVPTEWLPRDARADVTQLLARNRWPRAVVKPAVSAGAHRTWTLPDDPARAARLLAALLRRSDVMVQPFLEPIVTEGEWSLVFLGGRFSHAALKRPASGEFRVQERFGGVVEPAQAPADLVEQAEATLAAVGDDDLLYARVDGVREDRRLTLLELEVLEPSLFFEHDAAAPSRFVDALCARISESPHSRTHAHAART